MINDQYPIGSFICPENISQDQIQIWIHELSLFPAKLLEVVANVNEEEEDLTYRFGGWSVRKVVHHIADSQINAFTRIKLALTEDIPMINPYDESAWAEQADYELPMAISISIIAGIYERTVTLLSSLTDEQLQKPFYHPVNGITALAEYIGFCVWHSYHHLAHIDNAIN